MTATTLDAPRLRRVEPAEPRPRRAVQVPAGVAGIAAAAFGLVVLYGWLSRRPGLIQLNRGQVPMQFNTALCLALLGVALVLLLSRWYRFATLPAVVVTLWGALTLLEYALGRSLGVDTLLFDPWLTIGVDVPGRIARNTAACFTVLGAAILVLVVSGRRGTVAPLVLGVGASFVGGLALVALFGYVGSVPTAYTWRTSTAMAPMTAVCLFVLACGYVAAAWDIGARTAPPRWLPVPVAVGALAATLFLWQALANAGASEDRTLSLDRAAGVALAIGLVFSALLAATAALGQAAVERRRVAEALAVEVAEEAAQRAEVQETLLRRAQRDAVLRAAYAGVSSAPELAAGFAAFARAAAEGLTFERASMAIVGDDSAEVVAVAGPAAGTSPVGTVTPRTDPLLAAILASGEPYLMRDVAAEYGESAAAQAGIRSFVVAPVVIGGGVRALLAFASTRVNAFDDDALALVDELTGSVGGALYTLDRLHDEQVTTARLRELDQLKNEFVGVVAHDLRSPMTVIVGYIDTVLGHWDTLGDQQKRDLLGVASRNTRRLASLVEDVLHVARIESGELPYEIKPFDLAALVRRTADDMTAARPDRPVAVEVPGGLPAALGDEDKQWRVLTNLISNAQKFSPPDAPVVVRAVVRDAVVEVSVTDRGPGIPEEDQPRLFGKFSRLAQPEGGDRGTGLGLYICKTLVEAQGGTIAVDSTVGKGTTMRYTIPLAPA